jgi:hypothetical protein
MLGIALIVAVLAPGMIITTAQNAALKFEVVSVQPRAAEYRLSGYGEKWRVGG